MALVRQHPVQGQSLGEHRHRRLQPGAEGMHHLQVLQQLAHVALRCELAALHARVELAAFQGVQGSATESFAREGRELYHGNQVLAGQLMG